MGVWDTAASHPAVHSCPAQNPIPIRTISSPNNLAEPNLTPAHLLKHLTCGLFAIIMFPEGVPM